jgi:hypothetical protein
MENGCKTLAIVLVSMHLVSHCATTKSALTMVEVVRSNPHYDKLSGDERDLVNEICDEISKRDNYSYYFEKLTLLLNTPYVSSKPLLKSQQTSELKESVAVVRTISGDANDEEEALESSRLEGWVRYRPRFGWPAGYYVNRDDPLHIYIRVHVKLNGSPEIVQQMYQLEDAVEKHLSVPGFSVNLVWSDSAGPDVFEVDTDQGEWATSFNWAGDYFTMAHELMHLFGLPDEYNRIESHAGNKYIATSTRLTWFLVQMRDKTQDDAEEGIMWHNWKKPLPRHVCAAVGLGQDCIDIRISKYGQFHEVSD